MQLIKWHTLYRFMVACTAITYYIVTSNPTVRSVNTYYTGLWQPLGAFTDVLLPMMFLVSAVLITLLGGKTPYKWGLIASIPQFIYMALSTGWFVGTYPTTNPAAMGIHMVLSLWILATAWKGIYDDPDNAWAN